MTRKRPKLKLLVSFNGTFGFRPSSRKFRYTGGETRIISVDRNITYSKLKSRIADLVRPHGGVSEFSLKYRVFVSFSSGGGDGDEETTKMTTPMLILLESDDDVRCMVEEYEMAELQCKFLTRLWVFVCSDRINNENSSCTIGFVDEHVLNVAGDGFFVGQKGVLGDDLMTLLGRSDNNTNNKSGKKISDDYSLRKMVLRQQLLSKKLDEFSSSSSNSFRDVAEQSEIELTSENGDFEGPLRESCSEPESPSSFESKTTNFGGHLCRKATDYKYLNALRMARQNFGKVLPVTESNSRPLNPNDGNLRLGSDGPKGGFSEQSHMILGNGNSSSLDSSCLYVAIGQPQKLSPSSGVSSIMNGLGANCDSRSVYRATWSEMNRENIMPLHGNGHMIRNEVFRLSGHNQLTGSVFPLRAPPGCERGQEGYQDDIRNHRFGLSEAKNQRIGPYHIRSRSSGLEMGSNHNFKWEGRPWVGKFYPRLRSSSNISKPGPVFRSYRDASLKPFSGSCYHQVEERYGTMDHGLNNHNKIFRLPYCGQENLIKAGFHGVLKHERTNHGEGNAVYGGACVGASDEFPLPIDATARAVDNRIDLLTSPNTEKLDIACQALSANAVDDVGMTGENPFGSSRGVHLSDQEEVVNCGSPHNLGCSSGTVVSCDNKFCYTESGCGSNIYQSSDHTLDGHKACAVDLSLHNLSLASSRKLQLPAPPCATVDNSQCLLKLPSKDLDLMDEVHLNSGSKVEKSSDIVSNSSSDKRGKDNDEKQKMDFEEQDENKKTNTCLKVNGRNPTDIATFYSHLATRELQNIKNSDLECIKELGSGTCGTVYYGKWKGSDVAIKRIKASCFTDGAKEEDRLVADFWKEAHILGQLHHPNIVALYGIVTDGPANTLAIVTEYMVNGSLKQVLRKKDRTIDRRKRLIIAMDAAFGMEYLHEKNIVHFDLKSHNFLMNTRDPQRPICKIGDLGLSKIKQRTLVSGGIRGTIPWMAPELLNGKNLVSEKVDVYSFAIVMWELLTGEEPFADMRSEEIIAGILRGNLRPEIPSWCDPAWRSLMERCWSSDPDSRPSFPEIAKELRAMAAAMNIK